MGKEIGEEESYVEKRSFGEGMEKWKRGRKGRVLRVGGGWMWGKGGG